MAYRRSLSLSIRASVFTHKLRPSLPHIASYNDDNKRDEHSYTRGYHCSNYNNVSSALFRERGLSSLYQQQQQHLRVGFGFGSSLCSYSSSAIGEGSEKIEYMSDIAEKFSDTSVVELAVSQVPALSEVAIAAADSYLPVAALQYLIDGVHSFTGLNWWASIAITTILIRVATFPLMVNQMKATSKLTLMRPQLEEIKNQINMTNGDPEAMNEGQRRMKALFKEYGVNPFTPLKGIFIQGPVFISFFFAINNMVEKVPSFKAGGAFWFTDLTTPDALYIFPVLASLSFLLTVEYNMQEGLEGNPIAGTMKNVSRVFATLMVPFTMSFPKAMFCYWITANLFSLVYGQIIKRPRVKEILGLPKMPVAPTTTELQPAFSLFSRPTASTSVTEESSPLPPQPLSKSRSISSSSSISQRIKSLELQVKRRNKTKRT
ncbi:hypothetical protein GIB67_006410 [Kingdonia uniflora]|uniref:Membrane insertase YidC/Oxa/ALB C-terminal domain-containing protein n=1 Tax=Kingdonia uniflora TaxID=39325 RepID=A0A7J7P1G7_9MAGN|nr:hypothetical protein GIB67_006410 [Kingdonia uniflora]